MLKTNTKKAKENIRKYIINIYDDEVDYSNCGIDTNKQTFEEIAEVIKEVFHLEKLNNENIRNYYRVKNYSMYEIFKEWCQGLPSIIDTCYYYNRSAIKDLGDILEETEEERSRFTEEEAEEKLTYLIYREIFK